MRNDLLASLLAPQRPVAVSPRHVGVHLKCVESPRIVKMLWVIVRRRADQISQGISRGIHELLCTCSAIINVVSVFAIM